MDLSMPSAVSTTPPGQLYKPQQFVFDHFPSLRELLPKFRGAPGFTYFQCCVVNLRRAQDEKWKEVDNTVVYTVEGPKGSVDLKLLCRGKLTPGQPHNSGARLCYGDLTAEPLVGLWWNPQDHTEPEPPIEETPDPQSTLPSVTENAPLPTEESLAGGSEEVVFRSGGGPSAA